MFTACDGDVLVSTGFPQEVYAKLTVFTNVYLRSVPITRQRPLVSNLGLNKPEKTALTGGFCFHNQLTLLKSRDVMATQTIGTNLKGGGELNFYVNLTCDT